MANKTTIVLIEDDPIVINDLKAHFAACEDMQLVEHTNDSSIGIKLVSAYLPNVVLLDLELHHGCGNGFLFLDELKDLPIPYKPYVIVITQNMSDATFAQARAMGADFIITKYDKHYSPEYVSSMIRLMQTAIMHKNTSVAEVKDATPEQYDNLIKMRIRREMDLIGINQKNKGYNYLVNAIELYMQDPGINLSRALVNNFNKSEKSIERAMQNAIKRAWDTNDIESLLKHYTARIRPDKGCPTLMEFICYYSTKISEGVTLEKMGGQNW